MKQMKKTLCLLLALVMLLSLGPVPAFAEGETSVCTEHVYGEDGLCTVCGAEKPADPPACTEHVYGEDGLCTVCGAEKPAETSVCTEHVYGEDGLCTVCGAEKPVDPPVCTEHVYGEDGLCTVCGAEQPEETEIEPSVCTEHVYGEDGLCTVCGAEQPEETGDDSSTPAEASAQNDGEVEYPMQSFNFRADAGTEITVDAPEGAFPESTRMSVTEADLAEVQALIDADEALEGTVLAAVDISFYYHDEPIQPRVPVRVSYASAAAAEAVEPKVVHIADDDSIDVMDEVTAETVEASSQAMQAMSGFGTAAETPASTEMLKLSFQAGSFSRYAILGAAPVLLPANDNDADPADATRSAGEITISSSDYTEGQTEYTMSEVGGKGFSVTYFNGSGTDSTVLVVEMPKYGAAFAAVPGTGDVLQEVATLDAGAGDGKPRILLLRLADNSAEVEYFATFSFNHVPLTDAQSADLIDNNMPATRIAVTEYKYSGELVNVLSEGQKLSEKVYCSPKPTTSDTTVKATHTFKFSSSSVPEISNHMLRNCSGYWSNDGYYCNPLNVGGVRFRLPETYAGSPVEITSIKMYAPSDKLKLTDIKQNTGLGGNAPGDGRLGNALRAADFDVQWINWTRTEGRDDHGKYYRLTPPSGTRLFNNGTTGKTAFFFGFSPTWQLVSLDDPLPSQTDAYTNCQGYETVVNYKLPGTAEQSLHVAGPLVQVWARNTRSVQHAFNSARYKNVDPISNQNVIVGSYHMDEYFASALNSYYRGTKGSVISDYVPDYTGAVTQTLEFPFQIQPTVIRFYDNRQGGNVAKKETKLASLTYYTLDGDPHTATPEQITAINNEFAKTANGSNVARGSIPLDEGVTADNPVTKVVLNWDSIATLRRFSYPLGNYETVKLCFDYRVNDWTDATKTARLPEYSQVQVKYTAAYDGSYNSGADYSNDNYLWFRLKPQIDPDLYGEGVYRNDEYISFPLDGMTATLGKIGFLVGRYGERRDTIHDPVISFSAALGGAGFNGIDNSQALAFLTGAFTAREKLVGWTFSYTTLQHPEGLSYTVKADDVDRTVRLLETGDYFRTLSLSYVGDADLSHTGETDTRTVLWLMDNIGYRRLTENPFTGAPITVAADYSIGTVTLNASVTYEDCICDTEIHKTGQAMKHRTTATYYIYYLSAYLFSTRKAALTASGSIAAGTTIYQGDSLTGNWLFTASVSTSAPGGLAFGSSYPAYPWEKTRDSVYIELTDPEFVFDPETTRLYDYPASGANVEYSFVTVDGRRFVKLKLVEGFQRTRTWWTDSGWGGSAREGGWWGENAAVYSNYAGWSQPAGSCVIGFKTVPGTQLGDHHPIGDIYLDFSGLREKYHASIFEPEEERTGYDHDRTMYVFNNAVEDTLGLSHTSTVTGPKLFKLDGSGYTVKVELSLDAGVELAPGKYESYKFAPRVTTFRTGEENDLNALATFKGPGNESANTIFDMNGIIVLPRAGKTIHWVETVMQDGQPVNIDHYEDGEWDLFLRGAPAVVKNSTGNDPHYAYTTAVDPTAEGTDWSYDPTSVADDPSTPYDDGWRAVTGVRAILDTVPPLKSMNLRLNLYSDVKPTVDVKKALGGGTFKYRRTETDTTYVNGCLPLCTWEYENYSISSGRVFWDVYDENGTKGGNAGQNWNGENLISGVKVWLYDSNNQIIQQPVGDELVDYVTTNSAGQFPIIKSYKPDAGQYIVIENPTVTDGSTVKLTKKINGSPTQSAVDSDFDRDTNKLVLGTLNVNGVSNVSAGFVKLPQIEAVDVELLEGETKSADAIITEFVSNTSYPNNILVNGGYKISFTGVDATIATLDNVPALARSGNSTTQLKSTYTFTGVAPGEYEVTATVENALGDEVSTTFTVTVVPNVFYVYHSSDGTLEAVPMPDEGETVNLVDKIRTGHRYGGYYNASGAVTEENVNAAKDPALSAGRTGAAVTGAVLYTGDSLKNGSVRFWTKTDAAVAGTNDAGTELQPTRGAVYYLKEVPVKYLQSVTRYVYTVETGKLDALYFISDVDDTYYNQLYFDVQTEHGSYVCKLAGSFSFLQRGSTTITQSVKPSDFADVVRGFVASANASALLNQGITEDMFVTPYWKTLDGVDVPGVGFTMSLGDETTNPETGIQFYG